MKTTCRLWNSTRDALFNYFCETSHSGQSMLMQVYAKKSFLLPEEKLTSSAICTPGSCVAKANSSVGYTWVPGLGFLLVHSFGVKHKETHCRSNCSLLAAHWKQVWKGCTQTVAPAACFLPSVLIIPPSPSFFTPLRLCQMLRCCVGVFTNTWAKS